MGILVYFWSIVVQKEVVLFILYAVQKEWIEKWSNYFWGKEGMDKENSR